ncbi:hypothetical protein ACFY7F_22610 [Streptomyces griseofuscus]|uniref:hypothetical protein n=1 Tax=Streptomyces griseofuscus TaxID=146922 RepID=UPI0036AB617A
MDEPRAMRRERGAPAVRTAVGVGGICLAAVASWSSTLLVVRGQVVPGWGVSAVLLGLAVVLRWGLHRVGGSARSRRVRVGSRVLIGVAVFGTVWGAVDDLVSDARYFVLRPVGPGGCTAVVRETSFLVIGNGEAYAVGRTGLALGAAGSWTVDDGYRPVAGGTYTLDWGPGGGLLQVRGTGTDPVVQGGLTDIDCG